MLKKLLKNLKDIMIQDIILEEPCVLMFQLEDKPPAYQQVGLN